MTVGEAIQALRLCPPDQPFAVMLVEPGPDGQITSGRLLTVAMVSDTQVSNPDMPDEPVTVTAFFCTEAG